MKKISLIFVLSIILITSCHNYIYAFGFNKDTSITKQGDEWLSIGKEESEDIKMGKTDYWSNIAGVLTGIGIWVVVISGAVLGIRFMIATPDKKAEVKNAFIIWFVGTLIIMGALTIWRVLINILDI